MNRRVLLVTGLALIASTLTVSALAQETVPKPEVAKVAPAKPAVAPTRPGKKLDATELAAAEADEAEALVEAAAPPPPVAVAPPVPAPEPVVKAELPIRTPDETLDLKPETDSSSWTMKLVLVAAALAVAGFLLYRRKSGGWQSKIYELKVLSRASVGVRSELLVVDVDGRAMLLGITPSSIHRLATLGGEDATERVALDRAERDQPGPTSARASAGRSASAGLTVGREFADHALGMNGESSHPSRTNDVESAFEDMLNSAKAEQNERIRSGHPRRSAPVSARADLDLDDDMDAGLTDRAPRRSSVRPRNRYDAPAGRSESGSGMEQQVRGLMRVGRRA